MTVLLFFFNLLHWSCFVSLSQGLPHIDALRAESQQQTFEKLPSVIPTHSLHQVRCKPVFWTEINLIIISRCNKNPPLINYFTHIFLRCFLECSPFQGCFGYSHQCASGDQYLGQMSLFSVHYFLHLLGVLFLCRLKD